MVTTIEVEVDELCTSTVTNTPIIRPTIGFCSSSLWVITRFAVLPPSNRKLVLNSSSEQTNVYINSVNVIVLLMTTSQIGPPVLGSFEAVTIDMALRIIHLNRFDHIDHHIYLRTSPRSKLSTAMFESFNRLFIKIGSKVIVSGSDRRSDARWPIIGSFSSGSFLHPIGKCLGDSKSLSLIVIRFEIGEISKINCNYERKQQNEEDEDGEGDITCLITIL